MTVTKLAISLEQQLARDIKRSAAGEPISAWIAEAARAKLRREGWAALIEEYEDEHGPIADTDVEAVRARHRDLQRRSVTAPTKRRKTRR